MMRDNDIRGPATGERKVFALTLFALAVGLALIIWFKPASLLVIACVAGVAWCASMLFNEDEPRRRQVIGAAFPIIVGILYVASVHLHARTAAASCAAAILVILGALVWIRDDFGRRFYAKWLQAFQPLAWSISTLILVVIYYGVITPIGLAMRALGRDPMHRKFDRDATTYWLPRKQPDDEDRYLRQF
jgi:Saxitoxin biosynthesis operon protein SxtJ